jgi:glycosyltransferase involved in cell wall biosynthesis
LPDNFILFLGTIEPRKNLERLIRAYEKSFALKEGIPIVLSGKMGWLQNDLISKIQPLIEKKLIILTGYVNLVELKALYQSCLFFAFPSLYEGFGIPVLEAMASGAPVLTSGNSSLKELFSTSTHLVDPLSEESIVQGLNSMMDQDYRDKLQQSGYIIVKNFSWKKSAEEHKKLFKNFFNKR